MAFTQPDAATARAWLKDVSRPHRGGIRRAALIAIADVAPAIALAAGIALTVGGLADGDLARSALGVGLASTGIISRGILLALGLRQGVLLAADVKAGLRRRILDRALAAGSSNARQVTATVEAVEAADGYWSRFVSTRVAATVSPLLAIAACAVASPIAAAILMATLIPFILGMALAGTAASAESRRQFQSLERLSELFLDRIRALPAILSFQAERVVADEIAESSRELAARTESVLKVAFLSSAILEFFSALSVALVAVYCGFNLLGLLPFSVPEELNLTQAFFALAMAPEVYAPIRRLAAAYHDRQAAEAAAPLLAQSAGPVAPAVRSAPFLAPPSICFDGVSVRFDDQVALQDISISVRSGETVAFRGASGTGKTTLLKILLGLAPVSTGAVTIDGARLESFGDLAGVVAWAGQNPVVVAGTVAENIDLGRSGASREAVRAAAIQAGLELDLDRLLDERGGGLSGGERRRLGLARVILKDCPIVLLDEPTANLDVRSEQALLPAIKAACRGRTCLIATHSDVLAALAGQEVILR
jgi:ATP-binding cassette subfamily C protein CydD